MPKNFSCLFRGNGHIAKIHNRSKNDHERAAEKEKELDRRHRMEREDLAESRKTATDQHKEAVKLQKAAEEMAKSAAIALEEAEKAKQIALLKENSARKTSKQLEKIQKEKAKAERRADAAQSVLEAEEKISSINRKQQDLIKQIEALEREKSPLVSFMNLKRRAIVSAS